MVTAAVTRYAVAYRVIFMVVKMRIVSENSLRCRGPCSVDGGR
jgi:hypothetical protein